MNDFETGESMGDARYAVALLMFEGCEQRHVADKVRPWLLDVASTPGAVTEDQLETSVQRHFGEELSDVLKD